MNAVKCLAIVAAVVACRASPHADYQAHRGGRGLRPENTIDAFAHALALDVDTLEMDVMLTADDGLVVHHDERLNRDLARDASGTWLADVGPPVRTLRFEELARFDVGRIRPDTPYAERFAAQVGRDGVRIPKLADVIALAEARSRHRVRYNIEVKTTPDRPDDTAPPERVAEALVAAVRAGGVAARTTIQSFDWRSLRRVRELAPDLPLSCLTSSDTITPAWNAGLTATGGVPRLVRTFGCAVWSPDHQTLTRELVAEAHRLGLRVLPWTVNEPADMRRLLAWGVDGIITDFPDRLPRR